METKTSINLSSHNSNASGRGIHACDVDPNFEIGCADRLSTGARTKFTFSEFTEAYGRFLN